MHLLSRQKNSVPVQIQCFFTNSRQICDSQKICFHEYCWICCCPCHFQHVNRSIRFTQLKSHCCFNYCVRYSFRSMECSDSFIGQCALVILFALLLRPIHFENYFLWLASLFPFMKSFYLVQAIGEELSVGRVSIGCPRRYRWGSRCSRWVAIRTGIEARGYLPSWNLCLICLRLICPSFALKQIWAKKVRGSLRFFPQSCQGKILY